MISEDATCNQGKLVHDMLRSPKSCGSFIVIDEELSTIHFPRFPFKRHPLAKPADLGIGATIMLT